MRAPRSTRRGGVRGGTLLVTVALVATALVGSPAAPPTPAAAARSDGWRPPTPDDVAPVAGVEAATWRQHPVWSADDAEARGETEVAWPEAGEATVTLDASRPTAGRGTQAGELPVWVAPAPPGHSTGTGTGTGTGAPAAAGAPETVRVEVHDRAAAAKAGVQGLVIAVGRDDGGDTAAAGRVTVDYGDFASAAGGDWASRLRLVQLPACALTTPEAPGCATPTPLPSVNDAGAHTVSAVAPLAADVGTATVLAVTAAPDGDNGDYKATSLSPASTWDVSTQTGAFTWKLPLRTVPAVGGPTPGLTLSYSSQTMDGRTSGNNTQGSWAGDGFELWPGYIERSYRTCADDTAAVNGQTPNNKAAPSGDQCWWKPNASLSLNGRATELVDAGGGRWRGVADDGSRVELLTGAPNGDDDGEHWKVTTKDGTQYWFGRHTGPGGASGTALTGSTWTTQVYGNHPGEPGHAAGSFAGSRRTQAWRWNLDHVVDPHGNTMTLFYDKEPGAYGRENDPSKRTTYDRGGFLTRIEYANRNDAPATTHAGARVRFEVADRCKPGATCLDGSGKPIPASFPDTPLDQFCAAAPCTDQLAPTFWTQKRLARVVAQVHAGDGRYDDVESWALRHEWLDAGAAKGEGVPMFLRGVTRTGHVGDDVSDPEIVFDPGAEPLPNRVDDPGDNRTALNRWRIKRVTTETGAQVLVDYKAPQCTRAALPTPHANDKLCFPVFYAPKGETPTLDWFHKYVVAKLTANDNATGSQPQVTHFDYLDAPAWHYDDNELVKEDKRTWGQFRGFGRVRTRTGVDGAPQLAREERFLRGMDADRQPSGTRDVWVTDSWGNRIEDHEAYAGRTLERTTFDGVNGPWVHGEVLTPTTPVRLAASGILEAWRVDTGTTRRYSRTTVEPDGVRWARTDTRYDDEGLPIEVDDRGDEATAADDRCTRTTYARNPAIGMLDRVRSTETVGVACDATPRFPHDMVGSSRTTYDDPAGGWDTTVPTRGLPVKVEEIDRWTGSTPVWITTSTKAYDRNGRVTSSTDANGHATTTAYTPALAGPLTATEERNPLGHRTVTTFAPAWDLPTRVADHDGLATELAYDGLGRLRRVWLPGRDTDDDANHEFEYLVRNTAPTAVTTRTLLPSGTGHRTAVTLFDGWLRERQTQTEAPGGGRTITETHYNSRAERAWTAAPYFDESGAEPDTTLVTPGRSAIPSVTEHAYDGAGRPTVEALHGTDGERWRTTTGYVGDLTIVTPPDGGTRTAKRVDARGQTVEVRRYQARTGDPATGFDATTYTYDHAGRSATVTDPAGNVWRHAYDQRGREIRNEDPDKGTSLATYDAAGNRVTTTDARGVTLVTEYDALGRRRVVRSGGATGPVRARWTYDTLPRGSGRLSEAVRIDGGGGEYRTQVTGYDEAGRPEGNALTIPTSEGALCAAGGSTPCTFTTVTTYAADGQVATTVQPRIGDLAAEQLTQNFDDVGAPTTVTGSAGALMRSVHYDKTGRITQRVLGTLGRQVAVSDTLDDTTGRLAETKVDLEDKPSPLQLGYAYDPAGNLTRIHDTPHGQPTDTQCYDHDHLRRLVEAWTPRDGDCGPAPTTAALGGPGHYWHSYAYQGAPGLTGSRTTETLHATAGNTERSYGYPAQAGPAGSRPHALDRVTTDHPTLADAVTTYGYDAAGHTATRADAAGTTRFEWDAEGNLAAAVGPDARRTTYLYDAEGERLVRRDPGGTGTTLYLPGGQEVNVRPGSTTAVGTRYYAHLGETIGVRTAARGLTFVVADHHDTGELAVKASDLAVTRRRSLPFGGTRGTTPSAWPGDKAFVGGTQDPQGLVHLGARLYEPATGRFLSVDPLIDASDPQQMHGYAYGNNAPPTFSDPTGRIFTIGDEMGGGGGSSSSGSTPVCTGTPDRCADQRGLNSGPSSSTGTGTGTGKGTGRGGGRGGRGAGPGANRFDPGMTNQVPPVPCRLTPSLCDDWFELDEELERLEQFGRDFMDKEWDYDWGSLAAGTFNFALGGKGIASGALRIGLAGYVVVQTGGVATKAVLPSAMFGAYQVYGGAKKLNRGADQLEAHIAQPHCTQDCTTRDNLDRFVRGITPGSFWEWLETAAILP